MQIKIHIQLCKACGYCIHYCPVNILALGSNINAKGYQYAEVLDMEKCVGCQTCAVMCPEAAIELEE